MGVLSINSKHLVGIRGRRKKRTKWTRQKSARNHGYYDRKPVEPRAAPLTVISRDTAAATMSCRCRSIGHTSKAITSAFKLVVIEPAGFDECPEARRQSQEQKADNREPRKARCMIRQERYSTSSRGATYALNGNVQKVANNIFVFRP